MKKVLIPILLAFALLVGTTLPASAGSTTILDLGFWLTDIIDFKVNLKVENTERVLKKPSVMKGEVVMLSDEIEETTARTWDLILELFPSGRVTYIT